MATFYYGRKVHYYETDQMGIVHHSNYIRWMEEARTALFEELGLPYDRMERGGVLVPVLNVSCEYRSPFRFGGGFRVQVYPLAFNGVKLRLGYRIYGEEGGRPCASGETGHCFTDGSMQLLSLKKKYPNLYEALRDWAEQNQEDNV